MISPSRARVAGGAPLGEGQVPENTALLGRSLTRGPGMPWARPVLSLLVVGLVIAGFSALLALAVALALAPAVPAFADSGNGPGSSAGASVSVGSASSASGASTSASSAGAGSTSGAGSAGSTNSSSSPGAGTDSTSHAYTGFVPCSKCLVIHFDSRGGSPEPDEIEDIDNPAHQPASPPTRAGYRFEGWYACTVAPDKSLSNCTLWTWDTVITAQTPGIVSTRTGGFAHWEYTLFARWVKESSTPPPCTTPDCVKTPSKSNPGGPGSPLAHTGIVLAAYIIVSVGLLAFGLLLIIARRRRAHQLRE